MILESDLGIAGIPKKPILEKLVILSPMGEGSPAMIQS